MAHRAIAFRRRWPQDDLIWMSLKVFGLEAFRKAVARGISLAERAQEMLHESPCWQVVTPAQLALSRSATPLTAGPQQSWMP